MKQLIRRLSRVSDSSAPSSPSPSSQQQQQQLLSPLLFRHRRRSGKGVASWGRGSRSRSPSPETAWMRDVPEGHLPVYVGEEMRRFVVRADLLGRPAFTELLRRSAQEYGYEQRGVLRIPCPVALFQRVLDAMRTGRDCGLMDDQGWDAIEVPPSPSSSTEEQEEAVCR